MRLKYIRGRGLFKIVIYTVVILFLLISIHLQDTLSDCTAFNFQSMLWVRPRPHFLCVKFHGNLGDQMFQYAFLVANRIRYSTDIVMPYNSALPPAFDIIPQNEVMLPYCDCFKVMHETETKVEFDRQVLNNDVQFIGRFRSLKYFLKHENEVRLMFRTRRWLKNLSLKLLHEKLKQRLPPSINATLVGMFLGERDGNRKQLHEDKFIRKAMDLYRQQYENVLFIVGVDTSKTYNWFNHGFMKSRDIVVITDTREEVLLGVLTLTDHSIVLRDSVSWWAAWLSRGSAVYFEHPFFSVQGIKPIVKNMDVIEFPAEWTSISGS